MANARLRLVPPTNVKRTVAPRRRPNTVYRVREHLTEAEVERLIKTAGSNRWGHRDATMILVAFRHGLRAAELVALRWDQVDFEGGVLHVAHSREVSYNHCLLHRLRAAWCSHATAAASPRKAAAWRFANSANVVGFTPNSSWVPSSTRDCGCRRRSAACSSSASTMNGGRPAASIARRRSSGLTF